MWDAVAAFLSYPFVEAGITTVVLLAAGAAQRTFHLRHLRRYWRYILDRRARTIHVVLPSFQIAEFDIAFAKSSSKIPDNVVLMPFAEALGIGELRRTLQDLYPKATIRYHNSDTFAEIRESFITIGGPSVNRITHELLNVRRIDSALTLLYPDHVAKDSTDGQVYEPSRVANSIYRRLRIHHRGGKPIQP